MMMAAEVKGSFIEMEVLKPFPALISSQEAKTGLWDESYFVKAVG